MTSWDHLEAYLAELVKIGCGRAYVLRDSQRRSLAPRMPEGGESWASAMAAWQRKLDARPREFAEAPGAPDNLKRMSGRVSQRLQERKAQRLGERPGDEDFERLRRVVERLWRLRGWFTQHATALETAVGASFVTKGPGKRYVHRAARPLHHQRHAGRPAPDGDGDQALSNANRLA